VADTYDVVVLGSGPGGYVAAIRAAQLGLKTAIVEKDKRLGGTCLLRGCIPTKALLYTAELIEHMSHAAEFGIDVEKFNLNFLAAQKNKERVVAKMSGGVDFLMKKNKISVVKGHGRIAGKGKLDVQGEAAKTEVLYKNLIVATGSVVKDIPIAPPDHRRIVTSDSILNLEQVPRSLIVLGAGAVGMEFASIFAHYHSTVTVVEMLPHLLPIEDEDSSKEIERAYRRRKIEYHLEAKVERVETTANGVKVTVKKGNESIVLEAEMLLSAVGRKPVTEDIGLDKVAVKVERGFIRVDGLMRTDEPGIYAIGDVVPTPALAHVASHEGIVAAESIAGHATSPINYDKVPSCTYTYPEVASVGLTEKKARERGYDVKLGSFPFSASGKASILRQNEGFVKIVAEKKYDEVLGVHIVGAHATELIAEACAALRLETTTEELARTVHAHPTLSESIGEAAHAALGAAIHI
jgi:dihydrolipoamide dehydrogenase